MEPTPEEWPTSNGIYYPQCEDKCQCEALDSSKLIGRGNFTIPLLNSTLKLPTPPTNISLLNTIYADQAYAIDTDICYPDCLPATWRVDMLRAILQKKVPDNNVILVPTFWQLVAKGSPTSKGTKQTGTNHGDCTHRTMEALIVMNEQLVRQMMLRL
jgi:hypothetical protein